MIRARWNESSCASADADSVFLLVLSLLGWHGGQHGGKCPRHARMNQVADRAVRIRLAEANGEVVNLVVVDPGQQLELQHLVVVVRDRIVVRDPIVLG